MDDILKLSLNEIKAKIACGEVSSYGVTKSCLNRIKETARLNTLITVCEEEALKKAAEIDAKIKAGQSVGLLAGVPVIVKDNIATNGIRTTCASKILDNYVPPYDAFVVKKLKQADAVILGKANMDEFAMGSGNENSAYGPVLNPADETRVPGGSSGGSAASVAAYQCYASLGSDTGGSIRQPAAYCGVVGLKPTYSLVSRFGLIAFASSLDQIGPIARSAEDCGLMLEVISGYDGSDSTSADRETESYTHLDSCVKGIKIGVAEEFFGDALNPEIKKIIDETLDFYVKRGAEVKKTSIKSFEAALSTYYVLSSAEATSNLARFDGVKYGYRSDKRGDIVDLYYDSRSEGFGDEVKRRIMMGNYVLSSGYYDAYYLKASKIRTLIRDDFAKAFGEADVLICPTAPSTAYELGRRTADKSEVYLSDIYTVPVNIAGLPAVSFPCGKDSKGLPVGIQFIGKAYSERLLLSLVKAHE